MNEQQPYERHLAEKFQQLPSPDVEPNWQRMKSLLDEEMPRRGAYWKWITGIGIIIIMLFGGTWFFTNQDERTTASNRPEGKSSAEDKRNAPSDSTRGSLSQNNDLQKQQNSSPPSTRATDKKTDRSLNQISDKSLIIEETLRDRSSAAEKKAFGKSDKQKTKLITDKTGAKKEDRVESPVEYPFTKGLSKTKGVQPTISDFHTGDAKQTTANLPDNQKDITEETAIKTSASTFSVNNAGPDVAVSKTLNGSIDQNYYTNLFPERSETQKRGTGKSKRSKDFLAGQNKSVALGFSLPLGFPLGDQKPGAININARPNVISDFLPVPHMQYHINNKLYLQTEIQLMNPQYIQPVLLYQGKKEVLSTNTVYYNSVYAKKLYYFNIPVGIHYSPFQHFYLGTGLQFSSLVSGVALHEETRSAIGSSRYDLMGQRYAKFKNDSISNRIDNSEFRLMLDANYYWRQFTVGLRYNQALSNYVSFRLNNASPLFQDKNKSLQFYLRYNLWENHKKPLLVKAK